MGPCYGIFTSHTDMQSTCGVNSLQDNVFFEHSYHISFFLLVSLQLFAASYGLSYHSLSFQSFNALTLSHFILTALFSAIQTLFAIHSHHLLSSKSLTAAAVRYFNLTIRSLQQASISSGQNIATLSLNFLSRILSHSKLGCISHKSSVHQ